MSPLRKSVSRLLAELLCQFFGGDPHSLHADQCKHNHPKRRCGISRPLRNGEAKDEAFQVAFSNPVGATLVNPQAREVIANDDTTTSGGGGGAKPPEQPKGFHRQRFVGCPERAEQLGDGRRRSTRSR